MLNGMPMSAVLEMGVVFTVCQYVLVCVTCVVFASASHVDVSATRTCPFGLCVGLGLSWEAWDGFLDVNLGARCVFQ